MNWRVFWLTLTNRIDPDAAPELVFTDRELRILDRLVADMPTAQPQQHVLSHCPTKLARLGGYLARRSDSPPGNETAWRGLTRLVDIQLGVIMGDEIFGIRGERSMKRRPIGLPADDRPDPGLDASRK